MVYILDSEQRNIKPYTICEYSEICKDKCAGKDKNRSTEFSCGKRRLMKTLELNFKDNTQEIQTIKQGERYLDFICKKYDNITMDEDILSGMPSVKNRRINVSLIISCLRDGMTIDNIKEDYGLSDDEIKSAINYVVDILEYPFI